MGHRTNLIIIENGEKKVFYDHWIAINLDKTLFWDFTFALEYFKAQEKVDERMWLDELFAEGGAVLDVDKKYLLWFACGDIGRFVPYRRKFLELQRKTWEGWEVEWATRGVVDMAEYVGYPKENVFNDFRWDEENMTLKMPKAKCKVDGIGCWIDKNGDAKLYPYNWYHGKDFLELGSEIFDLMQNTESFSELNLAKWRCKFPKCGFVIDEKARIIEFWEASPCANSVNRLKAVWDDWEIIWHQDNYEFQLDKLKGKLVFPKVSERKISKQIEERLLEPAINNPLNLVIGLMNALKNEGIDVQTGGGTLKSNLVEFPMEKRLEMWKEIIKK
jgi:hypothetical protein